jgi:hypothetical protein
MNFLELVRRINKLPADIVCKLGNSDYVAYAKAKAHLDLNHTTVFVVYGGKYQVVEMRLKVWMNDSKSPSLVPCT